MYKYTHGTTFLLRSRFSSLVEYKTIVLKFSIFFACSCTLFSHSACAFFSSSNSKAMRSLSNSVCQDSITAFNLDRRVLLNIINHKLNIVEPVAVYSADWGFPLLNALNENPEIKSEAIIKLMMVMQIGNKLILPETFPKQFHTNRQTWSLARSSSISFFWRFNKAASVKICLKITN